MYKHVCDVSKLKLTVEDLIKYYKPATSVGLGMAGPAHGRVFIVHVTVYRVCMCAWASGNVNAFSQSSMSPTG